MDKACIPGDVDNGEKLFKARCTQCHTINKVPEISQTSHVTSHFHLQAFNSPSSSDA
jgi:cytochrome c